jgi:hypothetical protein
MLIIFSVLSFHAKDLHIMLNKFYNTFWVVYVCEKLGILEGELI